MLSPSDYDNYGFRRDEISLFLSSRGIASIDGPVSSAQHSTSGSVQNWPEWKTIMSYQSHLLMGEAAAVLSGSDPHQDHWVSDEEQADHGRWERILSTAIEAGDLITHDAGTKFIILPIDMAAWCDKKNIPWPLPWVFETATPSTDPELQQALVDARHEIAVLQSQVQALNSQLAEMGLGKDYSAVLDENSGYSPIEMRAALSAWLAVVSDGNPQLRGAAIKPALKQWLSEHRLDYNLGTEAIERCATVANWNKKGGAPKTPSRTVPPV